MSGLAPAQFLTGPMAGRLPNATGVEICMNTEQFDRCAILLLAAGRSERMRGTDKLMQPIDGQTLLRRQALTALTAGGPVLVSLQPDILDRRRQLRGLAVRQVPVDWPNDGIAASIRAGVGVLPASCDGAMILPADMPDLTADDLKTVLRRFYQDRHKIVRGAAETGAAGHPVVFPARLFDALLEIRGDQGARTVLAGETVDTVPLPGRHALTDLDTPEDWAAWYAARQT